MERLRNNTINDREWLFEDEVNYICQWDIEEHLIGNLSLPFVINRMENMLYDDEHT